MVPHYAGRLARACYAGYFLVCALIFVFLVAPLFVIVPLSFNAEPYFSFTRAMLTLQPEGFSLRWYRDILENPQWLLAIENSLVIGFCATLLATTLGTLAALGLSRSDMPWRRPIIAILISPMIVPLIITGAGMFFFYSAIGLAQSLPGIILAHTALGTPFVVITVTATLVGFDPGLLRAAQGLGAPPATAFRKVVMPLILPGVVSGALFAFVTSFDEVVVVLFLAGFEERTVPRQMWAGIREQISPTILAVATILVGFSIVLLTTVELLRRRGERLRGLAPG